MKNKIIIFLSFFLFIIFSGCKCPQDLDTDKEINPKEYAWATLIYNIENDFSLTMGKIPIHKQLTPNNFPDYKKIPSEINFFTLRDYISKDVIYNSPLDIKQFAQYTFIIFSEGTNLSLKSIEDSTSIVQEHSLVRFINIAKGSPNISFKILNSENQEILSSVLNSNSYSEQFSVQISSASTILLTEVSTGRTIQHIQNINFGNRQIYNLVLTGKFGNTPSQDNVKLNIHNPIYPK